MIRTDMIFTRYILMMIPTTKHHRNASSSSGDENHGHTLTDTTSILHVDYTHFV
jgi:hypothetical protein